MHWESMSAKSNRALPDDISTRSTQFHVWTYDKKRCESGAAQLGWPVESVGLTGQNHAFQPCEFSVARY